jgi:hypothetical protein
MNLANYKTLVFNLFSLGRNRWFRKVPLKKGDLGGLQYF